MKTTKKILFMGSLPTYHRDEHRALADQEIHFGRACQGMGTIAAQRGHTVLLSDDHPASADFHVMQGILAHARQSPGASIRVEVHRPEGSPPIYEDVPSNVTVQRCFHPDAGHVSYGTIIPNLAALDASDALVVIGGHLTVKLIGQVAADKEKPVLAIPSFGGTAAEIYESLRYTYKAQLGKRFDDLSLLRSVWQEASAERALDLVQLLARDGVEMAPHSYFLSYRWADSGIADHVEVLLHRAHRAIHRDESIFQAGVDLSDLVKSLIDSSDTFIALWNVNYSQSNWCPQELEYAVRRQAAGRAPNRIVLLVLDDTEAPLRMITRLHLAGRERSERELAIRKLIEQEPEPQP